VQCEPPPPSQIRMLQAQARLARATNTVALRPSSLSHMSQPPRLPSAMKRKLGSESSVEIVEIFEDQDDSQIDLVDDFDMTIEDSPRVVVKREPLEEGMEMEEPAGATLIKKKAPRTTSSVRVFFSSMCLKLFTF
jgi:hypothetical protein